MQRKLRGTTGSIIGEDAPKITDADYDVSAPAQPGDRGGLSQADPSRQPEPTALVPLRPKKFEKVTHRAPMLSLDNAMNDDDVVEFLKARPALFQHR